LQENKQLIIYAIIPNLNHTWNTKCEFITSVFHTKNGYSTSNGTSINCQQVIFSYILCSLMTREASPPFANISITSFSVPPVGNRSWWCGVHHACQSDTTQYGIVKSISSSTNSCTSWITDYVHPCIISNICWYKMITDKDTNTLRKWLTRAYQHSFI